MKPMEGRSGGTRSHYQPVEFVARRVEAPPELPHEVADGAGGRACARNSSTRKSSSPMGRKTVSQRSFGYFVQ